MVYLLLWMKYGLSVIEEEVLVFLARGTLSVFFAFYLIRHAVFPRERQLICFFLFV